MSEAEKPSYDPTHRATTKGHRDARAEALQKALRDNLRRRKAANAGGQASVPQDDGDRQQKTP